MTIKRESIKVDRFGRDDEGRLIEKHDNQLVLVEARSKDVNPHIMCRYFSQPRGPGAGSGGYFYTSDYPAELLRVRSSVREVTRLVNAEAYNYLQAKV